MDIKSLFSTYSHDLSISKLYSLYSLNFHLEVKNMELDVFIFLMMIILVLLPKVHPLIH